jgi:exodeoxyribonuclease VII large subunit
MHESSSLFVKPEIKDELTVSELSAKLKHTLEANYANVLVRGEISGLKLHTSGHAYFALKDETAVLDGICWRGVYSKLAIRPNDGMEVICRGKVTTYPGRSKYQIIVESMELAGQGALLQILEERKRKLAAEGLFSSERKKALPYLPRCIGVVTSETGAVIRDILHRIRDRFPTRVIVWPVLVQGQGAAEQVAAAIAGFNGIVDPLNRPDLLIVARGGGSLEDLWAFNEEVVIRAVVASQIPLISAVGHETDTTLIDYAADRRAPTPTAAAEMAVPVRMDLLALIEDRQSRLLSTTSRYFTEKRALVKSLQRGLPNLNSRLGELSQRLDDWQDRLKQTLSSYLLQRGSLVSQVYGRLKHPREILAQNRVLLDNYCIRSSQALKMNLDRFANDLQTKALLLNSYSFHSTLQRGFSIVKDQNGKAITSKTQTSAKQSLNLTFHDGDVAVIVDN